MHSGMLAVRASAGLERDIRAGEGARSGERERERGGPVDKL